MVNKIIQQTEHDIILTVGDKVYQADIETFELEAGGVFPRLPPEAEYRIYVPGEKHALIGDHGKYCESGDMPWSIGDNTLNNIDEFISMQTQAQAKALLQDQALYDESVRQIQIEAKSLAEKKLADTAAALVNYYKTKDGLKDYSANERWKKQIGGFVSGVFGKINTDDRSVAMLSNIVQSFSVGLIENKINFKGVEEWVELDKDQVVALAKEVVSFTQNCFNTELSLAADIEDGKVTTTEQIDQAYA